MTTTTTNKTNIDDVMAYVTAFLEKELADNDSDSTRLIDAWKDEENVKLLKEKLNKKKLKDPSRPKKGKSAYLFFCGENRESVTKDVGDDKSTYTHDTKPKEVTRVLGLKWKELQELKDENDDASIEMYDKYNHMAAKDKKRYLKDMESYKEPTQEELAASAVGKRKRKSPKVPRKKSKKSPVKLKGKTSYSFFAKEFRDNARDEDISGKELTAKVTARWKELNKSKDEDSIQELDRYNKMAVEDDERAERELDEFQPSDDEADKDYKEEEEEEEEEDDVVPPKRSAGKAKTSKQKTQKTKTSKKKAQKTKTSKKAQKTKTSKEKVQKDDDDEDKTQPSDLEEMFEELVEEDSDVAEELVEEEDSDTDSSDDDEPLSSRKQCLKSSRKK